MRSLLDYLLYALFGHNVTDVIPSSSYCYDGREFKIWTIVFEGKVYINLDERDLSVIRRLYDDRLVYLSDQDILRYKKIFDLCV